jgi:hypothetical protein
MYLRSLDCSRTGADSSSLSLSIFSSLTDPISSFDTRGGGGGGGKLKKIQGLGEVAPFALIYGRSLSSNARSQELPIVRMNKEK